MQCKICNAEIANKGLYRHLKMKHNISNKEYYDIYCKQPDEGICTVCGKNTPWLGIIKGYQKTCSISCSMLDSKNQNIRKNLYKEKTGYDSPLSNPEIRNKAQDTYFNKTGYLHQSKNPEVREQIKNTLLKRTGFEYPFQNKDTIKKAQDTYFNKTGFYHALDNPNVWEKIKENNKNNYGVEFSTQRLEVKEKIVKSHKKHFGYNNYVQSPLAKPGKHTYFYNNILFDSSWELAYYIWLTDNNIFFVYHPEISFKYYTADNKLHFYKPDFLVKDKYVEIKSDYLVNENCLFKIPNEKIKCMNDNKITILYYNDIKPILKYIRNTYGKNYIKSFKIKKEEFNI